MAGAPIQTRDDPRHRLLLRRRQLLRLDLAAESLRRGPPVAASCPQLRRDELERARGGRPVVVRDPQGEVDERQLVEDALDRRRLDARRRLHPGLDHDAARSAAAEADRHDRALADALRNLVREYARDRAGRDERIDGREHAFPA